MTEVVLVAVEDKDFVSWLIVLKTDRTSYAQVGVLSNVSCIGLLDAWPCIVRQEKSFVPSVESFAEFLDHLKQFCWLSIWVCFDHLKKCFEALVKLFEVSS